jgi:hypothetical protein
MTDRNDGLGGDVVMNGKDRASCCQTLRPDHQRSRTPTFDSEPFQVDSGHVGSVWTRSPQKNVATA